VQQLYNLTQEILRTDVSGMPLEWIDYRDAVRLYHTDQVAYTCGTRLYRLLGGTNAKSGLQTVVEVNSIIATIGHTHNPGNLRHDYTPPLNNQTLFKRDAHLCLYCGQQFHRPQLTRDHVMPLSKGGLDVWENVVSACFHCNSRKSDRTPQQAGMPLLAVPYRPSWIEHMILSNRNILADQMAFLKAQLPKRSKLAA
jgi:5-methylcytosine-specific restriction endonuclease McrA